MQKKFIAAIDQGTTSTRCILFDHAGRVCGSAQQEHRQIFPQAGWVEHDPMEIWSNTQAVISGALQSAHSTVAEIAAVGITNQRETTVLWERATGQPVYNALVWQDTRTDTLCDALAQHGGQNRFRLQTGLPLATYFSGPKLAWLLQNVPNARTRAEQGELLFGTIDSWLIWNLTGGKDGGVHCTDVTNASRTQLMNLQTLDWDDDLLAAMDIPRVVLPRICPSSQPIGTCTSGLPGVPIAGVLGDQQAALFGQTCFDIGSAKNTYGTGCFMLLNTGTQIVQSQNGLLTTLAYQLAGQPAVYALEGSIAIAGALVQWLRDNLGIIQSSAEIGTLAGSVPSAAGIYFVPAFSGLYAPYWRSDARGVLVGMTRFTNKGHIARAALEATAYQTREVLDAMNADSGVPLTSLRVDGGMVVNELLMQFQADILGVPVIRPLVNETTALGASYAAGLAVGFWQDLAQLRENWGISHTWTPNLSSETRESLYAGWKKAVTRSFDWIENA
ncbi:MAG TPA: glycerol kinase GlpK [Anaerolineales bacterium]|nr:glycerol kinase GlpK [Anaerolineales bacterium]